MKRLAFYGCSLMVIGAIFIILGHPVSTYSRSRPHFEPVLDNTFGWSVCILGFGLLVASITVWAMRRRWKT